MQASSGISFGGLFSGLDTESIISQLMYIERAPVRLIEQKQVKLNYEKEGLKDINNSLLALKSKIKSFADGLTFQNQFSSSDERVVTGSATAAASTGTYTVDVTLLATEQHVKSTGFAPAATVAGTFTIAAPDGETFTIDLTGGKTLTQIVALINGATGLPGGNDFADYGVAELLTDPGTGNQYITVRANETGVANAFTYTDTVGTPLETLGIDTTVGVGQTLNMAHALQNAQFTINGVAMTSTDNSIEDAVTGVTLDLQDTGAGVTVTVGMNDDDVVSQISDFVEQFNTTTDLLDYYLKEESVKNPQTQEDFKPGVLRGDMDLVFSKSEVRMRTTGYYDTSLTTYRTLAKIGIESEQSYGSIVSDKITFDEQTLRSALSDDREEVADLLEGWADELDSFLEEDTEVSMVAEMAGNYYRRVIYIDDRIDEYGEDISNWDERLTAIEERMRNEFSAMEEALQQLQTQSTYLSAQITNLLKSSSSSSN